MSLHNSVHEKYIDLGIVVLLLVIAKPLITLWEIQRRGMRLSVTLIDHYRDAEPEDRMHMF